MIEIAMRRSGARLLPVDDHSAEDLIRVPADRDVLVKIVSQRNMKLLRFLWALAGKVADACDWLHDKDDAMDELKIRARHVKYLVNPTTGEVRIVPKSLTKMDGAALNRLANRMVHVICRDIVPGLDESALRAEIVSMIAGPEDSNSVEPAAPQAEAQPDAPAAAEDASPRAAAAGNDSQPSAPSHADEEVQVSEASPAGLPSDLSPDWQDTYLRAMARVTDRPKSLTGRHAEALQLIGGKANADEKAWMTAVYRLTERRLRGEITKDECDAAVREIS